MITYHTFTEADQTYHIIDKFTSDVLINPTHIFVMTSADENDNSHLCGTLECLDCALRTICYHDLEDRLDAAVKLFPEILDIFPELGV